MTGDEPDERSRLVLEIRERVDAGTYRVASEDVADAIIAGPFAVLIPAEMSPGRRFVSSAEAPEDNHYS